MAGYSYDTFLGSPVTRKVFTSNDFAGRWPTGTAAVVVAWSEAEARKTLREALFTQGLDHDAPFTLHEVDLRSTKATILQDGDY